MRRLLLLRAGLSPGINREAHCHAALKFRNLACLFSIFFRVISAFSLH
jgi:hypothetical protein